MDNTKTISIIGAGSWGISLAMLLSDNKKKIKLWEYDKARINKINKTKKFDFIKDLKIPRNISLSNNLEEVCLYSDIIVIAVPSKFLRSVLNDLKKIKLKDKIFVSVVKGLEDKTFLRMSEIIKEVLKVSNKNIYVLSGPSHAEEVSKKLPTSVVLAGKNNKNLKSLQKLFTNHYFRVYTASDLIGVEIGGAIKNIIAIAAGICDGLKFADNTKAALTTRGLMEIVRFGKVFGADPQTFFGLSGMGDLIVTCYSKHSRNRFLGVHIGRGEKIKSILKKMKMVAEGYHTCKSVYHFAASYKVEMPITNEVYKVLYNNKSPKDAVRDLMTRKLKQEREV